MTVFVNSFSNARDSTDKNIKAEHMPILDDLGKVTTRASPRVEIMFIRLDGVQSERLI